MLYIDSHTHLSHLRRYADRSDCMALFVVDPTHEEFPSGDFLTTIGIHPMSLKQGMEVEKGESILRECLKNREGNRIVAIGEIGWDKRSSLPLDEQTAWVEMQLRIASEFDLPCFFHMVGGWDRLFALSSARKHLQHSPAWVVHGFRGTQTLLEQLYRAKILVSLRHLPCDPDFLSSLRQKPFFLESDDSGQEIEFVYRQFAEALDISEEELKAHIYRTFLANIHI
ncbi:MAG: TatD family hydrolase [Porphyromonas sp.]|nr:TatD family hydrolase [Porphyromonas sp.]